MERHGKELWLKTAKVHFEKQYLNLGIGKTIYVNIGTCDKMNDLADINFREQFLSPSSERENSIKKSKNDNLRKQKKSKNKHGADNSADRVQHSKTKVSCISSLVLMDFLASIFQITSVIIFRFWVGFFLVFPCSF